MLRNLIIAAVITLTTITNPLQSLAETLTTTPGFCNIRTPARSYTLPCIRTVAVNDNIKYLESVVEEDSNTILFQSQYESNRPAPSTISIVYKPSYLGNVTVTFMGTRDITVTREYQQTNEAYLYKSLDQQVQFIPFFAPL